MLSDLPVKLGGISSARPGRRQPQFGRIDVAKVNCHTASIPYTPVDQQRRKPLDLSALLRRPVTQFACGSKPRFCNTSRFASGMLLAMSSSNQ